MSADEQIQESGHTARAVELLEMALTDLRRIAEFMNERAGHPDHDSPSSGAQSADRSTNAEVSTEAQ